jgi:hypothetical protein
MMFFIVFDTDKALFDRTDVVGDLIIGISVCTGATPTICNHIKVESVAFEDKAVCDVTGVIFKAGSIPTAFEGCSVAGRVVTAALVAGYQGEHGGEGNDKEFFHDLLLIDYYWFRQPQK